MQNLDKNLKTARPRPVSNGMEIIPAILAKSETELQEKLAAVPPAAESVHIDLVESPPPYTHSFIKEWDGGRIFEAHLMLPDPRSHLDDLIRAGFSRVIVQVEDVPPEAFADLLHEWRAAVEMVPSLEIETPIAAIDSFAHELKSVQLMGIAEIGAQGRPFDPRVVPRVKTLHTRYPHLTIAVDGGVNKKNSERFMSAGAGRLVVGSALKEFYG